MLNKKVCTCISLWLLFYRSLIFLQTKQTQQIIQIQILGWKSTGACENLKIVTDVNEEVIKVQRRTGNKAIVVHCR